MCNTNYPDVSSRRGLRSVTNERKNELSADWPAVLPINDVNRSRTCCKTNNLINRKVRKKRSLYKYRDLKSYIYMTRRKFYANKFFP